MISTILVLELKESEETSFDHGKILDPGRFFVPAEILTVDSFFEDYK